MSNSFYILVLLSFLFSFKGYAFYTDMNFVYLSDSLTASSDTSATRTFFDLSLGIDIDKKGFYTVGWSYGSISSEDKGSSVTTKYSSTEMGPKFGFFFDKQKSWGLTLTYNLNLNATYDAGSSEEKWRGTSIKADFGYLPPITDTIFAGVKLNYYKATFNESVSGSSLTNISYSRGIIYPSIFFAYRSE